MTPPLSRLAHLLAPRRNDQLQFTWLVDGSGLLAALLACSLPLIMGIAAGWTLPRVAAYSGLALLYLLLIHAQSRRLSFLRWLCDRMGLYLACIGLICLGLISLSGDSFVQPVIFTVPFVFAAIHYRALAAAGVGIIYLGLLTLGLWVSGERTLAGLLFPAALYGALMVFMYAFTFMALEQATARQQANALADDLARQRDYLARLAEINANLTRNLDLGTVLEQVAAAGRTLAQAQQARVWLRETAPDNGAALMRQAAAVPPQPSLPPTDPHVLLASTATVNANTLVLPLLFKGDQIGALELRDRDGTPFNLADSVLLRPFADAAAVAIENARLYEQARLSAALSERNRLAHELHDTIAQGLTAVIMQIEAAQRSFERDPERARTRIGRAHELARDTLGDVRRSVWTLASPLIDGHTLSAALEERTQAFAQRTAIAASYQHHGPPPTLDSAKATQLLRIVQEALQNVEKHAQAKHVSVGSRVSGAELCVWVRDDGIGFDASAVLTNAGSSQSFGLSSLHERARLAGGTLHITSTPGQGSEVLVFVPEV